MCSQDGSHQSRVWLLNGKKGLESDKYGESIRDRLDNSIDLPSFSQHPLQPPADPFSLSSGEPSVFYYIQLLNPLSLPFSAGISAKISAELMKKEEYSGIVELLLVE